MPNSSVRGEYIQLVAVDANVLINFLHVQRLDLLGKLPGFGFVIPEEVCRESEPGSGSRRPRCVGDRISAARVDQ